MACQLNIQAAQLPSPLHRPKLNAVVGSHSVTFTPLRGRSPLACTSLEGGGPFKNVTPSVSPSSSPPIKVEEDRIRLGSSNNGLLKVSSFTNSDVATDDLCDANRPLIDEGHIRVLRPMFKIYGQRLKFSGPVVTLKVDDDNTSVWELAHSPGKGRVLLIDAGGQMRCALIGGILTGVAWYMGWAGVVVNGCIRDVDDVNTIDIGVRALGSHPVKPKKRAPGQTHVAVHVGGALIHDGEILYADTDGVLVSKTELDIQAAYDYKVDFEALHSIRNKVSNFPFIKKIEL